MQHALDPRSSTWGDGDNVDRAWLLFDPLAVFFRLIVLTALKALERNVKGNNLPDLAKSHRRVSSCMSAVAEFV